LRKFYEKEVLLEQELATSEEPLKVSQLLKEKEELLKTTISLKEWALFHVGS
jgi:hypothetical protein